MKNLNTVEQEVYRELKIDFFCYASINFYLIGSYHRIVVNTRTRAKKYQN